MNGEEGLQYGDKITLLINECIWSCVRQDLRINRGHASNCEEKIYKYQIKQISFKSKNPRLWNYLLARYNQQQLKFLHNALQIQPQSREQIERIFLSAFNDRQPGKASTIIIKQVLCDSKTQLFWLLIDFIKQKIKYIITKFTFPPISLKDFGQILKFEILEQNKQQELKIQVDFRKHFAKYEGFQFLMVIPDLSKQKIKEMMLYQNGGRNSIQYFFINQQLVELIRQGLMAEPNSILQEIIRNRIQNNLSKYESNICFSISNKQIKL